MTGLPRKLIYGKRRKKFINVAILPLWPLTSLGSGGQGEVEFVIIATERGVAITKGHSSSECYTKGRKSRYEAAIVRFVLPGMLPFSFALIYFIIKLQSR